MVVETVAAVASIVLALIAVAGYLANRKQFHLVSEAVKALTAIAENQRKQVEVIARQVETSANLQQRQLLLKQQEVNWNVMAGIAKAFGWAVEHGLFGEEDD